jgi:glycosyl transferase, family 25
MKSLDDIDAIPIYLITVGSFHDRHAHMRAQAEKFNFQYEPLLCFDAVNLTADDMRRVVSNTLPPAGISTVLKHIEAYKRVVQANQKFALILEDDVILFEDFRERVLEAIGLTADLTPGWLIFLGGADNKLDDRFFRSAKSCLIEKPISTTEAYLVDLEGCIRRLEWLSQNLISKPADHFLQSVDPSLNIKHYWISSPIATQGSITGKFKTALDSSRAKHGKFYLKIRYFYNRWRRQIAPRLLKKIIK